METVNVTYEKTPEEFRDLIEKIVREDKAESVDSAIQYLADHILDYKDEKSPIHEEELMLMIENIFGGRIDPPLYAYTDEIWLRNKEQLIKVFLTLDEIVLKLEEEGNLSWCRTENCIEDSDDIVAVYQNMRVYLAYFYYWLGNEKLYQKQLKEILTLTKNNMKYLLAMSEEKTYEYLRIADPEKMYFHGAEPWSEPLSILYHEWDFKEVLPLYEDYVKFLESPWSYVFSRKILKENILPIARMRLADLYLEEIERTGNELCETEEKMESLFAARKRLNYKLQELSLRMKSYG